jgi:putative ABC transport system permease protein
MLKLALRNLFRQRGRTVLTLAAIALGVASLVLSGGFVEDILVQLREATIRSQLGHLQIYRQGQYAGGGHRPLDFLIERPERAEQELKHLSDVVLHTRRLNFSGLISNGRGDLPILGEGVEPEAEARIGSAMTLLSGRHLGKDDRFGILVGEGLAGAMNLKVGDSVNVVLNTREGAMNTLDFQLVGVFRTLSREYDARAVRIALPAAQELISTEGVSAVVVLLADTKLTELTARYIQERLAPLGFEVKTWEDLADFYRSTAALYERQFLVLQVIILVMVLLSVANSVSMTLHERTFEFGIMRALGRTDRYVFRLAMLEMSLMGAVGAILGVVAGAGIAMVVSAYGIPMPPPPNSETGFTAAIRIVPLVVVAAFLLGLFASIGAAMLPARRLARVSIVEALRRGV